MRQHFGLQSVQLLAYEFPFHPVDLDINEDPLAHLNMADGVTKVLSYLETDQNHKVES